MAAFGCSPSGTRVLFGDSQQKRAHGTPLGQAPGVPEKGAPAGRNQADPVAEVPPKF